MHEWKVVFVRHMIAGMLNKKSKRSKVINRGKAAIFLHIKIQTPH